MGCKKFKCDVTFFSSSAHINLLRIIVLTRICRSTLMKLQTVSSTSVWAQIWRALNCLNLKRMHFWERSRSLSSTCYGSGRVTLCQDSRATWSSVNGCLNQIFWVSIVILVRPLVYHACEAVRIGGSDYEVHWLLWGKPSIWYTCTYVSDNPSDCI